MMTTINKQEAVLIKMLRTLPPKRIAEAENFVRFLKSCEKTDSQKQWMGISEQAFNRIWDNPEDEAYDKL